MSRNVDREQPTTEYTIDFQPVGRRGIAAENVTLLDVARSIGVDLLAVCGGEGFCGRCKVKIIVGDVSPISPTEKQALTEREVAEGYRLACHTYPLSDLTVNIPNESLSTPQRTQVEGLDVFVELDPAVRSYDITMNEPTFADLTADAERVETALLDQHGVFSDLTDLDVLRDLPSRLREFQWRVQASIRESELVAIRPTQTRRLGLAFDLGTTKIACYMLDLETGETVARRGAMNPQIAYGEDVISRLNRARGSDAEAHRLQELMIDTLNELAAEMCREIRSQTTDILDVVVVANTAIHHLFLRLPTEHLVMAPYAAIVQGPLDIKAKDLGLLFAAGAYVHVLPNIAAYVGGDHVAMILSTRLWQSSGLVLALDIGTNTEICLASNGALTSVSAASGPAFEGAHIKHGMRAATGAIEHVVINHGNIHIQTVGGAPPVGLCGSGIIDTVAQAFLSGIIDNTGKLLDHPNVRKNGGVRELVLTNCGSSDIVFSQLDIREVQLAKAAIRAGITALLNDAGRTENEIDEIIIAGAFGSYIEPASAIAIGLLPSVPVNRIRQVGNAAGSGARMALLSLKERAWAKEIAEKVRYIELANTPGFAKMFAKEIALA